MRLATSDVSNVLRISMSAPSAACLPSPSGLIITASHSVSQASTLKRIPPMAISVRLVSCLVTHALPRPSVSLAPRTLLTRRSFSKVQSVSPPAPHRPTSRSGSTVSLAIPSVRPVPPPPISAQPATPAISSIITSAITGPVRKAPTPMQVTLTASPAMRHV